MIHIAICDDDKIVCAEIENIILSYSKKENIKIEVDVFYRGEDFLKYIELGNKIDLVFLDIELNTTSGIKISNIIRNRLEEHSLKIVFITSKDGYEKDLFDVQPFNFIRKPIESEKILKCIFLLIKITKSERSIFEYRIGREIYKIEIKDIVYFESNLRKVKIVSKDGVDYFNATLSEVKDKLPSIFVEPHGSFLVNYDYIKRIGENEIIMMNGQRIEISRRYKKNIREFQIERARENKNANI